MDLKQRARTEQFTVELVRARSRHVPDAAPERLYKCVRGGEIIAWAQTLRTACMIVHRAYIAAHGPTAAPPGADTTAVPGRLPALHPVA